MSSSGSQRIYLQPAALLAGLVLLACGNAWSVATAHAANTSAQIASQASSKGSIGWVSLTAAQRGALAPLQKDWPSMDSTSQEKWLALANRFPTMSPAERDRVQARMTEWARTPASERGKARLRYQRAQEISPEQRQAQWTAYQNLPEEQRRELIDQSKQRQKNLRAPSAASGGSRTAGTTAPGSDVKSNIVPAPKAGENSLKSIAPAVVQAKPGATTNLVSKRPTPAPHLQPGLPKVAATPGLVDSATLLPRQGPQGIKAPAPESGASGNAPTHPKKS